MTEIIQFPRSASRRLHARKPRRRNNGTPEERAAKKAVAGMSSATVLTMSRDNFDRIHSDDDEAQREEIVRLFCELTPGLQTVALNWLNHLAMAKPR